VIKALRTFRVRPSLPTELAPLAELGANLRWAWHPPTQELFRWADPDSWEEVGGNPVELLGRLTPKRTEALVRDKAFLNEVASIRAELDRYLTGPRWAQSQDPAPPRIAYFSPEFGITHVMQTYSGGLGVLAGDHLKAASDLGLDLVGVGLLYRGGYFRQHLDASGWQQERYPDLNPYSLPLRRLSDAGVPVQVEVDLAGSQVACHIWRAQVGRIPLLLLDTDVASNREEDRVVTDKLYGGDAEHRLRQELVLGIGGVRALELAASRGEFGDGWQADVFHMNEGHAGFLQAERIRRLVRDEHLQFFEAVESARARVLFTTHTPVAAGIDVFPSDLMGRYFGSYAAELGIELDQLLAIGRWPDEGPGAPYNMAVSGLRLSAFANGVSQLHGRVSREMFSRLWPALVADEVPITSVTNGVHAATWMGREMAAVYDRHLSPDWYHNPDGWGRAGEIGDDMLWRARMRARERLVGRVRVWARQQAEYRGESPATLGWTEQLLDPDALTIGFARRFAEYKRGTLLLSQPERLHALVTSTERPVQFVFAGKSHPRDELGKDLIRQLVRFAGDDPAMRTRIVFVEDYDMGVASVLYSGVDVWLNNPRRPYEACGTSGEKAVLNGALHCSTFDGWWDELYDGENGFSIGSQQLRGDAYHQDAADAQSLFDLLERTVVPMFYDRTEGPLPRRWLARVRRSITSLGPQVLAERMVREYVTELYAPLAVRAEGLTADGHRRACQLAAWRQRLQSAWPSVAVAQVVTEDGAAELGQERTVEARLELGGLTADDIRVELLHGAVRADGVLTEPQTLALNHDASDRRGGSYRGTFAVDTSGEYGYALRVVPQHADLPGWSDTGLVRWADPERLVTG